MKKKLVCALIMVAIIINWWVGLFYPTFTNSLLYFAFLTIREWDREVKGPAFEKAIYAPILAVVTDYLLPFLQVGLLILVALFFPKA